MRAAQEQARAAAEQSREQARAAAEQAREQAKAAAEQARDQAKAARNQDDSSDQKADKTDKPDRSDQKAAAASTDKKPDKKADVATKNDDPPATVADWWKQMWQATPAPAPRERGPDKAPQQADKAEKPQAPPPERVQSVVAPAAAGTPTAKARPSIAPTTLPSSYVAAEVLLINPSQSALTTATRGLQFKVNSSVDLAQLRMTIYRMAPPIGTDAVSARASLEQLLKAENVLADSLVALNRVYRPYRTATSDGIETNERERIRNAGRGGCGPDKCYANPAIGWRDELKACGHGIKIGVIDTAIDHAHPAFNDARIQIGTSIGEGRRPAVSPHGTGVLALLAGSRDSGTPGLIPNADFYVADIFHADGNGQALADTVAILQALSWMHAWGVKIVNISVAGSHDTLMESAIEQLSRKGMLFIAAAGNEGPNALPMFPAAYKKHVIAVTAVAKDLRSFRQANRGDYIDVAAPGVEIWTAMPGAKETYQTGTSFAVPFVTAAVAAVYDQAKTKDKKGILNALDYKDLGVPGPDPVFGRGLIKAPTSCRGVPAAAPPAAPEIAAPVASATPSPMPAKASGIGLGFAASKP